MPHRGCRMTDVTERTTTMVLACRHTPGPWKFVDAHNQMQVSTRRDNGGTVIGIADICDSRDGTPEWRANARLIAAAPDMLEALKVMTDVAQKAIIASGTDPEFAAIRVADARAAIAEATGQPRLPEGEDA